MVGELKHINNLLKTIVSITRHVYSPIRGHIIIDVDSLEYSLGAIKRKIARNGFPEFAKSAYASLDNALDKFLTLDIDGLKRTIYKENKAKGIVLDAGHNILDLEKLMFKHLNTAERKIVYDINSQGYKVADRMALFVQELHGLAGIIAGLNVTDESSSYLPDFEGDITTMEEFLASTIPIINTAILTGECENQKDLVLFDRCL